jgi:crotonobetainyl-CoA:carnitine CoA-transferase CaiB-like acyl-CoA transferase
MPLPLSGIRVLDLTRLLPGAVCTLLLADAGADVVKIESPDGGDYARMMSPAFFAVSNRNKRSVIINLKNEEGVSVFKKLVESADVLVESYRPGVLTRLGCSYETLAEINPRLIYCALSGWGQDGPYAQREGHDLNYVALAGMTSAMPQPQPMGGQIADVGGAYIAVAGIVMALFKRERQGVGSFVDVSLFESGLPFAAYGWIEALSSESTGALTGGLACYNVYEAKDGKPVAIAALEPKFWENFCATVDRTDLIDNYTAPDRQRYLKGEVAEIFARRTADEWQSLLYDAECCFSLVNPPNALANEPQIQARGAAGVDAQNNAWLRSPIHTGDDAPVAFKPTPGYGAHTREILREAGYSDNVLEVLAKSGAIQ